ncbi:hypothetical protein D3C85_1342780 [compost metagenome]
MKRPACQCSDTRVRDNTDTQANNVKLPASDNTTPWVSGVIGRSNGLPCSHASPGKVSSGKPRPRAAIGKTSV